MRRSIAILGITCCVAVSGCSVPDVLFGALGDYYSGGGTTIDEKRRHYDEEIAKWEDFRDFGESR